MEVKLESLIEKIKKDGVEEAKKSANEIIRKAREEAASIIEDAKVEAERMLEGSRMRAQKLKDNTESSLRQAARDLVLVLKQEIVSLFDRLLKRKVSQELDADFMKELIVKIVDKWSTKKGVVLETLVNKADKKRLEELLLSRLKGQAKEMVEIKVAKSIDRGFRIGIKGEDVYYDFTDESILESLKEFLNPAISKILDTNKTPPLKVSGGSIPVDNG